MQQYLWCVLIQPQQRAHDPPAGIPRGIPASKRHSRRSHRESESATSWEAPTGFTEAMTRAASTSASALSRSARTEAFRLSWDPVRRLCFAPLARALRRRSAKWPRWSNLWCPRSWRCTPAETSAPPFSRPATCSKPPLRPEKIFSRPRKFLAKSDPKGSRIAWAAPWPATPIPQPTSSCCR